MIIILEPAVTDQWAPFGNARPLSDLRAGAVRIHERWAQAGADREVVRVSTALAGYCDVDGPPVVAPFISEQPTIVARADFAPAAGASLSPADHVWTANDEPVAWRVSAGDDVTHPPASLRPSAVPLAGMGLGAVWTLLDALEQLLPGDLEALAHGGEYSPAPPDAIVLGDAGMVSIAPSADIEPGVVFDVRKGRVLVEADASIRHGTRLEGPLWIGSGAKVVGGFIRAATIGPMCVVHGEVSNSIFLGYANKAHDGFVGHSIIGHWANLGALTTTSNLKNTYGPIRMELPGGRLETGRQFLGSLIGDHAKTAIGTMLSTGSVVGTGANVFGQTVPPRWVPPFAWGLEADEVQDENGLLRVASRVMPRRGIEWTAEREESLRQTYRRLRGR